MPYPSLLRRVLFSATALTALSLSIAAFSTAQAQTGVPSNAWQLSQQSATQSGENPPYDITVNRPVLASTAGNAAGFNQAVQTYIDQAETDFRQNLSSAADLPAGSRNYLLITNTVSGTDNGYISVRFLTEEFTGGAHPSHALTTLNYNLTTGAVLKLADLFKPGIDYLTPISTAAIADLSRQNRLSIPDGATPKAENYANWTIDQDGLLFSFDEYQIGPYAQGISEVYLPFSDPAIADNLSDTFLQGILSHPTP